MPDYDSELFDGILINNPKVIEEALENGGTMDSASANELLLAVSKRGTVEQAKILISFGATPLYKNRKAYDNAKQYANQKILDYFKNVERMEKITKLNNGL